MELTLLAVSAGVFCFTWLGVLGYILAKRWAFPVFRASLEAYWSERWSSVEERLDALESDIVALPRVWEEFARDSKKAQERARWHVRRVKKELEERGLSDAEIDSLDSDLRGTDGEGSNGQGLLSLQDAVAEGPETPPTDPMTQVLMRKWGRM